MKPLSTWRPARESNGPNSLELVHNVAVPAALVVATVLAATPWLRVFDVPGAGVAVTVSVDKGHCTRERVVVVDYVSEIGHAFFPFVHRSMKGCGE